MDHAGAVVQARSIGYFVMTLIAENRNARPPPNRTLFLFASVRRFWRCSSGIRRARRNERRAGRFNIGATLRPHFRARLRQKYKRFLCRRALYAFKFVRQFLCCGRARPEFRPRRFLSWRRCTSAKSSAPLSAETSDRVRAQGLIAFGWRLRCRVCGFALCSRSASRGFVPRLRQFISDLRKARRRGLSRGSVSPAQRGAAYGLYNLAFGVMVLPASLLMGALWSWRGAGVAFLVSAGVGVAATLLLFTVDARRRKTDVTS